MNVTQTPAPTTPEDALRVFEQAKAMLLQSDEMAVQALRDQPRASLTNPALLSRVLGLLIQFNEEDHYPAPDDSFNPYAALERAFNADLGEYYPTTNIRTHSRSMILHLTVSGDEGCEKFIRDADKNASFLRGVMSAFSDQGIFIFKVKVSRSDRNEQNSFFAYDEARVVRRLEESFADKRYDSLADAFRDLFLDV